MLSIRKGSLDEEERLEIESHVTHTFDFLRRDPLDPGAEPDSRHRLRPPREAGRTGLSPADRGRRDPAADPDDDDRGHLRRADRAGPALQARRARPRALDIMQDEVKGGMLDSRLFRLFVDHKLWERSA